MPNFFLYVYIRRLLARKKVENKTKIFFLIRQTLTVFKHNKTKESIIQIVLEYWINNEYVRSEIVIISLYK